MLFPLAQQANGGLYQDRVDLPQDEQCSNHSRILTVTSRAATKMIEFNRYSTNHGPVAFFEYLVKGEHNIGVIARTGPGILTVYQLATLGEKAPGAEDRKRIRGLIGLK